MNDFCIIGGGIVGLATGLMLLNRFPDAKIVILEKETMLAYHQTGHNSGVIHSGIYYAPGSLKAQLAKAGVASMKDYCQQHRIPCITRGKLIVATHPSELPRLETLYQRGLENEIPVRLISGEEVREQEPYVNSMAAIEVATTGVVDYRQVAHHLARDIEALGGEIRLNHRVTGIQHQAMGIRIQTTQGPLETRYAINCGGLFSDRLSRLSKTAPPSYRIVPFRGEYYELVASRQHLVNGLVYPVPNPAFPFLGVHLTRGVDEHVHVGPNAVLSLKREGYRRYDVHLRDALDTLTYPGFWRLSSKYLGEGLQEMIRSWSKALFVKNLQRLVPDIQAKDLNPAPCGVRAQALKPDGSLLDDFLIVEAPRMLHVCNAPSPAATASLEIGRYIVSKIPPQDHLKDIGIPASLTC